MGLLLDVSGLTLDFYPSLIIIHFIECLLYSGYGPTKTLVYRKLTYTVIIKSRKTLDNLIKKELVW